MGQVDLFGWQRYNLLAYPGQIELKNLLSSAESPNIQEERPLNGEESDGGCIGAKNGNVNTKLF